jgi:hypothetical protein
MTIAIRREPASRALQGIGGEAPRLALRINPPEAA